jgi:hypothetical protein
MAQIRKNKREFWRGVFRRVMSRYDEIKSVNGTMSCTGFYKTLAKDWQDGNKWNPKIIKASLSDFLCDIELTAKRTLSESDYRFFRLVYMDKDEEIRALLLDKQAENNKFNETKKAVQEKLGEAFVARKLNRPELYFKPKDTR